MDQNPLKMTKSIERLMDFKHFLTENGSKSIIFYIKWNHLIGKWIENGLKSIINWNLQYDFDARFQNEWISLFELGRHGIQIICNSISEAKLPKLRIHLPFLIRVMLSLITFTKYLMQIQQSVFCMKRKKSFKVKLA